MGLFLKFLIRKLETPHDLFHVGHVSPAETQLKPLSEITLGILRLIVLEGSALKPLLFHIPLLPLWLVFELLTDKLMSIHSVSGKLPQAKSTFNAILVYRGWELCHALHGIWGSVYIL
jgi:hypothetical protein